MNRARLSGEAKLVNCSAHFLGGQAHDYPLDLPPVAETHDIARVAASLGPKGRLKPRIVAEPINEIGGVG